MIVRYVALTFALFFLIESCSSRSSPNKQYAIGQDTRWQGLQLMSRESFLSAFNYDLLSAIAEEQELQFQLKTFANTELLLDLEHQLLDGILSSSIPFISYQDQFILSDPYFLFGPVLVIRMTAPLEGWNEKAQKILAIPHDSPIAANLEQDSTVQIKFYTELLHALSDLRERKIDGVLFPAIPTSIYVKTFYPDELKIVSKPLTQEGIRLIALNNPRGKELIKDFNAGLTALKENGEYDTLLKHWGWRDIEKIENESLQGI